MRNPAKLSLSLILVVIIIVMISFLSCAAPAEDTSPSKVPEQTSDSPSTSPPSQPSTEPPAEEPTPEPKEAVLKYHDSHAEAFLSTGNYGSLISFVPPGTPFTITEIGIGGALYGSSWEDKEYTVSIWDKDYKVIYTADYPVTQFELENPKLVTVEIPDVVVNGEFYVHVFTGTGRLEGLHVGADDSITNEHSGVAEKSGETFKPSDKWPYPDTQWFGDKSKVNWLIHVVGTYEE
jgi:hypothetical protein